MIIHSKTNHITIYDHRIYELIDRKSGMCESTGFGCCSCMFVCALCMCMCISGRVAPPVTHITNAKHRVGTWVYPAGNPVNTRRPDGLMSYGPFPTPDTPFTDHSGEPLQPAWPLHLPRLLHIVWPRRLCPSIDRHRLNVLITNHLLTKDVYWFIYRHRKIP